MTREFDADVVIAGGGPSGLVVAIEVVLGGGKALILEKRDGPTWSRAGNMAPRIMEIFESRGLADKVMKRAQELHADPHTHVGIWAGLGPIDYLRLDSDYKSVVMLAQNETEKLLADHFRAMGGEMRLRSEVTGFNQDEDGVTVTYRDEAGEKTVRGRYLVGADGGRSAVREIAGIGRHGTPAKRIAVNVDALVDNPHGDVLTVSYNEHGWAMTYPLRDGVTRFAFIDAATMNTVPDGPIPLDRAKEMLRRVHGTDYDITEVDAINWFHDANYLADRIRDRRLFLVGESVRIHYPASGIGMANCMQDAFNLGWKLAAAIGGRAPDWLLDTYVTERLPEIKGLLEQVRIQTAIQFGFDEEHLALKRFFERNMLPDPDVNLKICNYLAGFAAAYPAPGGSPPIVGRRLPNLSARRANRDATTVFRLLRTQEFVLLDLTGGAPLPDIMDGVRLVVAHAQPGNRPLLEGLATVLVRPDGHVAWASQQPLGVCQPDGEVRRWLNMGDDAAVFGHPVAA